jgi:hypothetical protein
LNKAEKLKMLTPMKRSVTCMGLLCCLVAVGAQFVAPAFYKGLEGPKYTVLKKGDGWELRRYQPASWVSTKLETMELDQAISAGPSGGFMKLFSYISGANAAKTKIDMTVPVLVKVEPGQGPTCNSMFTVSFHNPYKYQGSAAAAPPKPSDPASFINNMPAMDVYVTSFGGFANGQQYKQKAAELMQKLTAAKEPFNDKYWFVAGYDSPVMVTNRHNEVWVPAATTATNTSSAAAATAAAATKEAGSAPAKKTAAAAGRRML